MGDFPLTQSHLFSLATVSAKQ